MDTRLHFRYMAFTHYDSSKKSMGTNYGYWIGNDLFCELVDLGAEDLDQAVEEVNKDNLLYFIYSHYDYDTVWDKIITDGGLYYNNQFYKLEQLGYKEDIEEDWNDLQEEEISQIIVDVNFMVKQEKAKKTGEMEIWITKDKIEIKGGGDNDEEVLDK